jgi:hypothetical protein
VDVNVRIKTLLALLAVGGLGSVMLVQIAGATHPRPLGASPMRVAFVPAYQPCSAPDRTHGPPLAFPSCSSPQQVSTRLTVGNPPAQGANLLGSFHIRVKVGTPGAPDDSGAPIRTSITDVRCVAASGGCATPGADYAGELEVRIGVRVSDHCNATTTGCGVDPATMQDIELSIPATCAATSNPAVGATCGNITDIIFEYPGIAKDGRRMILALGQVLVLDGGDDGDTATDDGAEAFLKQGIFIP